LLSWWNREHRVNSTAFPRFLSVVIPAFDEGQRIRTPLREALRYLDAQPYLFEVLVVSDGSTDDTADAVREVAAGRENVVVLENGANRGKGFAVRRGMLEARGDVMLFSDADGATPIEEVRKLLDALAAGCDIAIGWRGLRESNVEVRQPRWREAMGRMFNVVVQRAALPGIHDSQCGFKCFTREAARRIFPRQRVERFGFDVEVLFVAQLLGYGVAEVPVRWRNDPRSTVHPIRDSASMLADLVRLRVRHARGLYGPRPGRLTAVFLGPASSSSHK
jgi:dolichyl-phosphate beta-glucosyltransferase